MEVDSGTGDIRLDAESTAVLAEVGGAGEGNGYLDVGEWARVWFGLKNVGAKPWFSTSGWFEADGQCLWVNPREEHVVGEMPQNGGTASVDAWVYVSRACTGGARRLKITIRDTHRNPSGMTLSVGLRPLDVVGPRIVNGKFDTDVPGSSDGSGAVAVAPGLKFEYSLDLQVPSKAVQAVRMRYVAPDDLAGLFQQFEYRDVPLLREAPFFRAADDLDAEMAETEAFRKALRDARGSKDWSRRTEKNRLWLAVDSTLMADRPGAVSATVAAEATAGKPAANEGARDCVPALPSKVVVELARKYVLLRARPATPTLPGSVVAAEGYEAGIDAERFAVAYDHLLKPPAATASEPEVLEPKPLLKYRFRSYFPLNLLPVNIGPRPPEPAPDAEVLPPPPEPLEPAPEPAPQPAREPQGPVARIDLGGAWTGYFTEGPTTGADFWNNAGFLSFGDGELRLTFGRTLCFTLLGEFGASIVNPSAAVLAQTGLPPALSATELAIAAGGAYVLRVGERFELMPFLMVGYRYRAIEAFSETHGVDFLFGASLRVRLVAFLGLYADISWRLGTGGPAWQGSEILNGIGPRLGGGLSINL